MCSSCKIKSFRVWETSDFWLSEQIPRILAETGNSGSEVYRDWNCIPKQYNRVFLRNSQGCFGKRGFSRKGSGRNQQGWLVAAPGWPQLPPCCSVAAVWLLTPVLRRMWAGLRQWQSLSFYEALAAMDSPVYIILVKTLKLFVFVASYKCIHW